MTEEDFAPGHNGVEDKGELEGPGPRLVLSTDGTASLIPYQKAAARRLVRVSPVTPAKRPGMEGLLSGAACL